MIDIRPKLQKMKKMGIKQQRDATIKTLEKIKDVSEIFDYLLQTFLICRKPNKKLLEVAGEVLISTFDDLNKGLQEISIDYFHNIQSQIKKIENRENRDIDEVEANSLLTNL